jgi:UDP-3-O-[3-hydroxymyristoyl] glucosamine N-acyltransferase
VIAAAWDGTIHLEGESLASLAARHGGQVRSGGDERPLHLAPLSRAGPGDLAPVLGARGLAAAQRALRVGAALLVDASVASRIGPAPALWIHDHATWAMAELLDQAVVPDAEPVVGAGCAVATSAKLGPRVVLGARVRIGDGAVIGHPGFGWAAGADGRVRAVPQLGGVVIEDDVAIGPLSTVDAGTLAPTRIRRGAKLDAHVHVGHNADIGEDTIVAAQCGFAGSVVIGRGVRIGGQAGIADHITVGDGASIAAKSGVIGDVPAGATVAGYPAVERMLWLRALAALYSGVRARSRAGHGLREAAGPPR